MKYEDGSFSTFEEYGAPAHALIAATGLRHFCTLYFMLILHILFHYRML